MKSERNMYYQTSKKNDRLELSNVYHLAANSICQLIVNFLLVNIIKSSSRIVYIIERLTKILIENTIIHSSNHFKLTNSQKVYSWRNHDRKFLTTLYHFIELEHNFCIIDNSKINQFKCNKSTASNQLKRKIKRQPTSLSLELFGLLMLLTCAAALPPVIRIGKKIFLFILLILR